jgi:hypothetical protein
VIALWLTARFDTVGKPSFHAFYELHLEREQAQIMRLQGGFPTVSGLVNRKIDELF